MRDIGIRGGGDTDVSRLSLGAERRLGVGGGKFAANAKLSTRCGNGHSRAACQEITFGLFFTPETQVTLAPSLRVVRA